MAIGRSLRREAPASASSPSFRNGHVTTLWAREEFGGHFAVGPLTTLVRKFGGQCAERAQNWHGSHSCSGGTLSRFLPHMGRRLGEPSSDPSSEDVRTHPR